MSTISQKECICLGLERVHIAAPRFDSAKMVFSLMEMPAAKTAPGRAEAVDI